MDVSTRLAEFCRLCATKTLGEVRYYIFSGEGRLLNLSTKLSACLPVTITEEDRLPKIVCKSCVCKLDLLYAFRENCIKTETYFNQLLEEGINSASLKQGIGNIGTSQQGGYLMFDHFMSPAERTLDSSSHSSDEILPASASRSTRTRHSTTLECKAIKSNNVPGNQAVSTANAQNCDASLVLPSSSILGHLLTEPDSENTAPMTRAKKAKPKSQTLRKCLYCKLVLTSQEYVSHIKVEHKKEYECLLCKDRFRSSEVLALHLEMYSHHKIGEVKKKDKDMFKCSDCDKSYQRKDLLELHMRSHTGERPFACTLCDKKYSSKGSLNTHILKHKGDWKHVCNYCGKGFVDKHNFLYHVRSNHTGERPFSCDKCDRKFIKKQDLQKHQLDKHNDGPKQHVECQVCGKLCKDADSLRNHKRIHIPVEERKVHKCNICEASYTEKSGLSKHMQRHTGEMPYECHLCTKRFLTKNGLELHLVIHSGVKSFICEICGNAFAQANTLKVHRRTHTGERPYACDVCHKRFTQSSALNSHRKLHFKDRA